MAMKSAPPPPAPEPVNSVPSQLTTWPVMTLVASSVSSPHSPVAEPPRAKRAKAGMISMTAASQRGMARLVRSLIPAVGTVITSGSPAASAAVTSAGTGERVTGPVGISPPEGGGAAGGGEGGCLFHRADPPALRGLGRRFLGRRRLLGGCRRRPGHRPTPGPGCQHFVDRHPRLGGTGGSRALDDGLGDAEGLGGGAQVTHDPAASPSVAGSSSAGSSSAGSPGGASSRVADSTRYATRASRSSDESDRAGWSSSPVMTASI